MKIPIIYNYIILFKKNTRRKYLFKNIYIYYDFFLQKSIVIQIMYGLIKPLFQFVI